MDAKIDSFINFSLSNFALKNSGKTSPEIKTEGSHNFKGEAEVVLKGRLTADGFHTDPNGVMAKCPSKYESAKKAG